MLNKKTALSVSPLALLTLAACGGTTGAGTQSIIAQKGPLNLATAYLDYNDDGDWDQATEPGKLTGVDGSATFSLALAPTAAQTTAGYDLKISGSANTMDMSSGAVFDNVLSAPSTSKMITPVTTMVAESGLTAAQVVKVLGLPAGMDPLTFNAFSTTLSAADKLTALKVEKTAQKTMAILETFETAASSSGVSAAVAAKAALDSVVKMFTDANTAYEAAETTSAGTGVTVTFSATQVDAVKTAMDTQVTATFSAAQKLVFDAQVANNVASLKNVVATFAAIDETNAANLDLAVSKDIFSVVSVLVAQVKTATDAVLAIQTANTTNGTSNALTTQAMLFEGVGAAAAITASVNNPGPTNLTLSSLTISEDAASLVVGTVTTTDTSDTGTAAVTNSAGVVTTAAVAATVETGHTYSIATVAGTDGAKFSINASTGVLTLLEQPDYETKTSYTVAVKTTEAGASAKSYVETFTIAVTDVVESGGFGISSDTVAWTDYNPATSATQNNQVLSSTSGATVTLGQGGIMLNSTNMKYLTDDNSATDGVAPVLSFTLDSVPTGSGNATVKATITDGIDGTRSGTEDQISLTVNVSYMGDGTTATITVPPGTATGTYNKGDGTEVTFNLANGDIDAFSITAATAVSAYPTLDVKLSTLYDAFIAGGGSGTGGSALMIQDGDYHLALETTLPLQNLANATVTNFNGRIEMVASTKASIIGTAGDDTITGTAASEVIAGGSGKDTISTGGGSDFIVLHTGAGSTTLANADTIAGHASSVTDGTGFTNSSDKFALDGLTFAELTIAADTAGTGTNVSITATGEYLITITDLAHGFITANDFVLVADIA